MHAFVRSRSKGYLGEITHPDVAQGGETVRVAGNWKGTPPDGMDDLDDLLVFGAADGPPAPREILLTQGRVVASASTRLAKTIEGRSVSAPPPDSSLGFSPAAR